MRRCLGCGTLGTTSRCARCNRSPYNDGWPAFRLMILERDGRVCQLRILCEGAPATTVDHTISLGQGGQRLDPGNARAACLRCNSSKRDR